MSKDPKPAAPAPEIEEEEPTVPVEAVEPDSGEGDDLVQLVRSGWVRLRWSDQLVRLRRPFLGELKTLRLALEDASDAISDASEDTQLIAARLIEEGKVIDAGEEGDVAERVKRRRALQRESRDAGRKLTELAEEERVKWWRLVIEMLSVDDLPLDAELPSWIVDVNLPNTILQHWRSVPLGRG